MDADLEAILAESDSSNDDLGGGLSLEDILREDEGTENPLPELRDRPSESHVSTAGDESYSARDWAVLQQILREDDDDDEVLAPVVKSPRHSPATKPKTLAPLGPKLWRGDRLQPFALRERRLIAQNESVEASPLETKRRARAKPIDLSRRDDWACPPTIRTRQAATDGRGALQIELKKAASRQLAANARRPELGPGAPSSLGASSKFVAVGTRRGLALVFDHFQEVRRVLGVASTDAVTCLSLEDDVACLGHASGALVLWDVLKGTQLRRIDDAFAEKVLNVKFCARGTGDRAVACIDASGVVDRIVFRQRVLGGSYLHEVECLLDAKSNVTSCLSVSETGCAFSSTAASFVVCFSPTRVAVTWPRPEGGGEAVVFLDDGGLIVRAWGNDLDALDSINEGSRVDFERCTLPAKAVALCRVNRGVVVLGEDRVLRLIDHRGFQKDAVDVGGAPCIATSVDAIYALAGDLVEVKARSAQQRIASLVDSGEWLEALSLQVDAVQDDTRETPHAIDLLRRYVALAVANAPARRTGSRPLDLARSHFKMLASVCVEFCVAVDVLEVLFDDVYRAFQKAHREDVYLDLLEPYILSDKLKRLAPEVLQALVERYREKGALVNVERCMLHLDPHALDFNMLTRLLKTHRLHSATYRIYGEGLGDFVAPLEIALDACHAGGDLRHRGGQALLYARYCLEGLAFPSGNKVAPTTSVLWFLLRKKRPGSEDEYPDLALLFTVDAQATLDVLSAHLMKRPSQVEDMINPYDDAHASQVSVPLSDPPLQYFLDAPRHASKDPPTKRAFYEYVAAHAARGVLAPDAGLAVSVLRHLSLQGRTDEREAAEDDLDAWATLPRCLPVLGRHADVALLQKEAASAGRSIASLILLEFEASRLLGVLAASKSVAARTQAAQAMTATIEAAFMHGEPQVQKRAFAFISRSVESFLEKARRLDAAIAASIRDALPSLAAVDACMTAQLVTEASLDVAGACQALASKPALQFVVLDELIEASDKTRDHGTCVDVGDDERAVYVELLCDASPRRVHAYLASHDGYGIDETLALCRKHRIDDATALLLEEKGDAQGALDLILRGLAQRFEALRDAARKKGDLKTAEADLRASVEAATRLCKRREEDYESRRAWFATLDALLEAQRALNLSRELPSTASQVRSVARDLARSYLSACADRVPLRDVVSKLFADHPDATLGDFRDVLTSALAMSRVNAALYQAANACLDQDEFSAQQKTAFRRNRGVLVTHLDGRALKPPTDADPPALHAHLELLRTAPDAELKLSPMDPKDPLGPWQAHSYLPDDEASIKKREEYLRKLRAKSIEGAWTKVEPPGFYNKYIDCEDDPAARMRVFADDVKQEPRPVEPRVELPPRAPPGSLDAVAKFSAALPKGLIDGTASDEDEEDEEDPFRALFSRRAGE